MEYNQRVYHYNPNRPAYSVDDLDMALVLSHTGDFDPSNPAHTLLLQPNLEASEDEEADGLSGYFKDRYQAWLEEEVFQEFEGDLGLDDDDDGQEDNSRHCGVEERRGWELDLLTYATQEEKARWEPS